MKMRGKVIVLPLALAVTCVFCIAVHEKNNTLPTNTMTEETDIPSADATTTKKDTISSADTMPEKINIPSTDRREDNWQNHLGYAVLEEEDSENAMQTDADTTLAISSEDHKYTVFISRDDRQKLYIYNNEENKLDQIDVTPDLATDIMNLEWIAPDKVAVWSHVNPSLGCLDIYEVNSLQKLTEKYCSSVYSLAEGIDTLIYIRPAPHFSSTIGKEAVLNINDEILYRTGKNEIISSIDNNQNGDIAIVVEKVDINYETKSTDLIVLKKKGKKYKVREKSSLEKRAGEEIHWIDDNKISYSTRKGKNKIMKLKKP